MKKDLSVFLLLALAGCAAAVPSGGPTQWMTFPAGKGNRGVALESWLKEHPLKADQGMSIEEISRGETASAAIVQIRKTQPLHLHADHDLTAIVLKGEGLLRVGDRNLELRPGSIITIPRGVAHSFTNKSQETAVAYAMFNPAFDGKDFVVVPEESLVKTKKQ